MNDRVYIQYLGFRSQASAREYTLRVLLPPSFSQTECCAIQGTEASQPQRRLSQPEARYFTLTIPHEAFLTHRARYQDGPDICFLKLQRELAIYANNPPETHFRVTDAELDDYRKSRPPHAHRAHVGKGDATCHRGVLSLRQSITSGTRRRRSLFA